MEAPTGVLAQGSAVLSVRLQPGEDVFERLPDELRAAGGTGAAIVAAVGSFSSLTYAVTRPDPNTIVVFQDRQVLEGAIEVGHFQGHLGFDAEGEGGMHCHGVFALEDGSVVGGHVFAARVLATLEVTLLVSQGVRWRFFPFVPPGATTPAPGLRYLGPERV